MQAHNAAVSGGLRPHVLQALSNMLLGCFSAQPGLSHGQLYVATLRVGERNRLNVMIVGQQGSAECPTQALSSALAQSDGSDLGLIQGVLVARPPKESLKAVLLDKPLSWLGKMYNADASMKPPETCDELLRLKAQPSSDSDSCGEDIAFWWPVVGLATATSFLLPALAAKEMWC